MDKTPPPTPAEFALKQLEAAKARADADIASHDRGSRQDEQQVEREARQHTTGRVAMVLAATTLIVLIMSASACWRDTYKACLESREKMMATTTAWVASTINCNSGRS